MSTNSMSRRPTLKNRRPSITTADSCAVKYQAQLMAAHIRDTGTKVLTLFDCGKHADEFIVGLAEALTRYRPGYRHNRAIALAALEAAGYDLRYVSRDDYLPTRYKDEVAAEAARA